MALPLLLLLLLFSLAAAGPDRMLATLRPCNVTHRKEQGWVMRDGADWGDGNTILLNTSIKPNRLPHCGWCLEVAHPPATPSVRQAACCCGNSSWCGRETCPNPAASTNQAWKLGADRMIMTLTGGAMHRQRQRDSRGCDRGHGLL